MKKIFFLLAAACALVACDPVQEDIANDGHITLDELVAKTTVTVDKAASGQNGNVITCSTAAPVNAKWDIGGKEFIGNFAKKKMKLGEYNVVLTAICADGTELTSQFPVSCQEITDPLQKFPPSPTTCISASRPSSSISRRPAKAAWPVSRTDGGAASMPRTSR